MMQIYNMPQRSPEWHAIRAGKITGSRVACLMPGKRGGYLSERQRYIYALAAERVGVALPQPFTTAAMMAGIEREPEARRHIAFELDCIIEEVGFIGNAICGCSPDGIATMPDGTRAVIEIKCPEPVAFVEFASGGELDSGYAAQVQFGMLCAGCSVAYIGYYHPDFPRPLSVRKVWKDGEFFAKLEQEIEKANQEISEVVKRLL